MRRTAGFTLLELLVALAIFAVLSAMAYGGLRSVLDARHATDIQAKRLNRVQSALMMLERDLIQLAPRPIRDEYGDERPPLLGSANQLPALELTRGGQRNPGGQARSHLQRIAYAVEDDGLQRLSWQVLDRAQDSVPYKAPLLDKVRSLELRFMDQGRQWHPSWPPVDSGQPGTQPVLLAVELNLELEDLGLIRRLVPVPKVGP